MVVLLCGSRPLIQVQVVVVIETDTLEVFLIEFTDIPGRPHEDVVYAVRVVLVLVDVCHPVPSCTDEYLVRNDDPRSLILGHRLELFTVPVAILFVVAIGGDPIAA